MKDMKVRSCDSFNVPSVFNSLTVIFILISTASTWMTDSIDAKHPLLCFYDSEVETLTLFMTCWLKPPGLTITVVGSLFDTTFPWMILSIWIINIPHAALSLDSIPPFSVYYISRNYIVWGSHGFPDDSTTYDNLFLSYIVGVYVVRWMLFLVDSIQAVKLSKCIWMEIRS